MLSLLRTFLFWLLAPIGLLLIFGFWPWWLMVLFVLVIVIATFIFPPDRPPER